MRLVLKATCGDCGTLGLFAVTVLIALVFILNLLRAPHAVYAAMKFALARENRRWEEKLGASPRELLQATPRV
jgi:hypothetical protein